MEKEYSSMLEATNAILLEQVDEIEMCDEYQDAEDDEIIDAVMDDDYDALGVDEACM